MTRRLFGTLCGLVFLVNFGRVAFAPLVEPLMGAFAVGEDTIGLVVTLVWLGTAAARIPTGYLLTRYSRNRLVLGTGGLLCTSAAFTALAPSVPALAAGAFCVGIASGAYFVTAVPLVGRLYPDRLGRAVGIHGTAAQLAAVAVPAVAAAVIVVESWRGVFWLLCIGAAALTLVLSVTVRDAPTAGTAADASTPPRAFTGTVRAHWPLLATAIVLVAAAGFVWQGVFNFYVTYMTRAKGLPPGTASTLLTVAFAAGVPAFWFGGRLVDRFPHVPAVLAIIGAFAGSLLVLTATTSLAGLFVVTALLGFVIHCLFPALDAFVLESLPADSDASGYAVFSGLALSIEATGSAALGALLAAGYGFEAVFRGAAFGLCGLLCVLCALYRLDRIPGARSARNEPNPTAG